MSDSEKARNERTDNHDWADKQAALIVSGHNVEFAERCVREFAAALREAYEKGREEQRKTDLAIIDDELGNESDNDDDARGHLRSMHIGAMDALRAVFDRMSQREDAKL